MSSAVAGAGAPTDLPLLVVDDLDVIHRVVHAIFAPAGVKVISAHSPSEALAIVRTRTLGAVLQDMNYTPAATSGREGEELFRAIRALDPELPVMLMTAWTSLEAAVALVREGAADYFEKPWSEEKLLVGVRNALELRAMRLERRQRTDELDREWTEWASRYDLRGFVFRSAAMHRVLSLALNVAKSDAPVLISGPNGTGKEILAEIIFANSRRADRPFVRLNIGGLPDELLEAELFGAEQGAYTGAVRRRIGRFESAHGGTLFLDEIGNMSMHGQARLLRVLQTGEFERLGSSSTRRADVRIVSATNVDLPAAIAAGRFREDLYFRLNVIELRVPKLSERADDILPIAEALLGKLATTDRPLRFSDGAQHVMRNWSWPGNVRELANRIHRASIVCNGSEVTPDDLDLGPVGDAAGSQSRADTGPSFSARDDDPSESRERAELQAALDAADGVVARAAATLGLTRQALYRRMERLGLAIERRTRERDKP